MESIPVSSRCESLDKLVTELTLYECRYLRDRLRQRLHCDVMGKLPLELAISIAAYLDPVDIVALRRVSRQWYSLLTAKAVSRQVCLNSFPQQNLPDSTDWTRYLEQRSSHEHALACGRPWSKADFFDSSLDLTRVGALHGSNFAWCAKATSREPREHICVLSLGNGTVSRYFPSTGSMLLPKTIALSDVLVGCISRNGRVLPQCEIFDILEGPCHSFRLPSPRYRKFVLQGDKIACFRMPNNPLPPRASVDIVTWNLISKEHHRTSFEITEVDALQWILGYDSIHMISPKVSAEVFITEIGVSIYYAHDAATSLDICKVSEISIRQSRVIATQQVQIADTRPTWLHAGESSSSSGQNYVIIPQQEVGTNWSHSFKLASLNCRVYSLKTEHLIERDGPATRYYHAPRPLSPSTYWVMPNTASRGIRFITWERGQELVREVVPEFSEKDAVIEFDPCPDFDDGLRHRRFITSPRLLHRQWWPIRDRPIFGNHSFFVIPDRGRIKVYCFDKKFVLPNENLSYRKEREEKARARKAKIRHE